MESVYNGMSFNLFAQPTKDDIRVGYIDPVFGYVEGVTICEANEYAKNNPGTTFLFRDGNNTIRYLNINEVNGLSPNDLVTTQDDCGGIQQYKECGPPRIQFFGGGGVGAAGNPVIGRDGSLLAVDVVRGGHGYEYAPIVAAKDDCQFGNGAVLTAILGETPDQIEVFDGEEDFENYEICEDTSVGFGLNYGPNGEELGAWEPGTYTKIGEDPIKREIELFQKAIKKPFWTTRRFQPDRIIVGDNTISPAYDANSPLWGEFMNKYAISPVKPSEVTGSDNAGKLFRMEWEQNFPVSGEYIFRGVCDNTAQVYIDGGLVGSLKAFDQNPTPLQKSIQEGNHIIRVDLVNRPFLENETALETQEAGSLFVKEGSSYYMLAGGNDQVNINFVFDWGSASASSVTKVTLPTEKGPLVFSRPSSSSNGSVKATGSFKANKKYGPITIEGRPPASKDPQIVDTGPAPDQKQQRINFFGAGGGIDVKLTAASAEQLSGARTVETGRKIISAKSWGGNPIGVSMIIDAPTPPVPQEQPPVQTGRCPPNPIWSTRFPGSSETWYPVRNKRWAKFFNRYAVSPVLPLNTPGSDGSGITHRNSWDIEIPYRGFYQFQVQRDNTARIYVDGSLAFDVTTSGDSRWTQGGLVNKVKAQKVFLERGRHTISVELENTPQDTPTVIDKKIFSTQDWRSPLSPPVEAQQPADEGEWVLVDDIFNYPQTYHKYSEGTWYNGKRIRTGGDWNDTNVNSNYIQFDENTRLTLGSYHPGSSQRFGISVWQKKKKEQPPQQLQPQTTSISKNGVTYEGPELFAYQEKNWSRYMNDFAVSPKVFNSIGEPDERVVGTYTLTWKNVNFSEGGTYKFNFQADNIATLKVGDKEINKTTDFKGQKLQFTFNVTSGKYDVSITLENIKSGAGENDIIFTSNPIGVALFISKDVILRDSNKTSWIQNPMGISAILIPPPCAKKIGGRGVVDKVIVNDPGNGYLPPQSQGPGYPAPGYPATLVLDEVIVEDPGINYRCGEDQLTITPNNGAELDYDCDAFGRIRSVKVLNPGVGFNTYPLITMPSETGINARFRPVFRVLRDPIAVDVPQDRLIQVTDLVGLKQTGYVDGRAYYGAVYYDEGVAYAGYYKTAGPQIQVYATLKESIDAQVTTPPSAIQRSGTDIRSNDPRLNIPGTPESTSEQ